MIDIGPPPKLWTPPRPAIIRSAADIADRATFPFPTFAPRVKRFPVVQGVSGSTGSGSSISVALPSGVAAKDLLVIFHVVSGNRTISIPAGWSGFVDNSSGSVGMGVAVFSKVAAGGETSVVVSHAGGSSNIASLSYRISGAVLPVQTAHIGPTSANNPNPPSLTVPWGVDKTLWLVASFVLGNSNPPSAAPSGFSSLQNREFNNVLVSVAQSSQEVETLDPGVFTQTVDSNSFAATIAVRGA